jgi:6-phosphogluconate dehydrogenase
MSTDVAVVGLGELGRRLVTDLASAGHLVAACNRSAGRAVGLPPGVERTTSIPELVQLLAPPRRVILAVEAGRAPDDAIEQLVPRLEPGDVIVDAGNSHFADTTRRSRALEERGIGFLGAGMSGFGAGRGPAITVGGSERAWPLVADLLASIAGRSSGLEPYCAWVGDGGAGHFAKLVHNAIEYVDMQLICEGYDLLRHGLGLQAAEVQLVFGDWSRGELASYLVEITATILAAEDDDRTPLVERVLDVADQKGTGGWAVQESIALGVPATLVAEAVHARNLSAMKDERIAAADLLGRPVPTLDRRGELVDDLRLAMLATRAVSYTQAFMLLQRGGERHGWTLDRAAIARIWQGGSIIGSALLGKVGDSLAEDGDLPSLLLGARFRTLIERSEPSWRRVVASAVEIGLPVPTLSASLAYYDGYRASRLPANLLQAQRDHFAAHTYERVDRDRGIRFHTDWHTGATRPA